MKFTARSHTGMGHRRGRTVGVVAVAASLLLIVVSAAAAAVPDRLVPHVAAGDGPEQNLPSLGPFGVNNTQGPSPSGRVQDLAADPFVAGRYLALSDAALWQSMDSGATWTRLPGLERFGQWNFEHGTIAFDPLVRGVVLVVSPSDRRSTSQVGVYRSTDGGQIWLSAINFRPTCTDGTIGSPSVVVFHGHEALVGGGCVVGRSTDDGTHWTWTTPDAGAGFNGVTYDTAGNRFACGQDGIFKQTASGWTKVVDFTSGSWSLGMPIFNYHWGMCRIVASPFAADHVFFAARWTGLTAQNSDVGEAYVDSAHSWVAFDLVGSGHPNGRDVGVQTRPGQNGGFVLYWGTDDATQFQTCTQSAAKECAAGQTHDESMPNPPWTYLGQGPAPNGLHADQTRIIFSTVSPYCILFVSDDGGIQRPRAGNCNGAAQSWDYSDRGISAVEFYETSGTTIVGAGHPETDLYGASQDDDMFVRLDGDSAWRHIDLNGDSFHVDATTQVGTTQLSDITTFVNSDGNQWIARRGLGSLANPAPGNTLYTPPCTGLNTRHEIDQTLAGKMAMLCLSGGGSVANIYISGDHGQTWMLEPSSNVSGHPGDLSGASVYVTRTPSGANSYLVRIAGELWYVVPGTTPVRRMPSNWDVGPVAVASDGSRILTFACPPSPATCAGSGQIRIWNRSSNTWHDVPVATSMLSTDQYGHTYPLDTNLSTDGEAASVSIAPHDPNLLAIATRDVGVLLSGDGGVSWQRVPMPVGNINGVWFDNTDRLYVSSFGRGMFGDLTPTPDQLSVTPHRQSMGDGHEQWAWTAHLTTATGAPVSGAHIRFTLKNDRTGDETEVGYGTTGTDGVAHGSRSIPVGTYHLLARWQPRNLADVDTEAPLVAEPTVVMTSPTTLVQTATSFLLSYAGRDSLKSALTYDVRYRIAKPSAGFQPYARPKAWQNTSAVDQKITATPGQEWCFGVRAHDKTGITSPWTVDRCTIVPLDDRQLSTRTSGWTRAGDTSAYLQTVTETKAKGESLRLKGINGNGIAVVVTMCPQCGPISIYVGKHLLATQSTYAPQTVYHAVLPLLSFSQRLTNVTIRTTSAEPVFIDGVAVRHGGG